MYKTVFLDANILADIYDETRPFCTASRKALAALLANEETTLYTSCDIVTTLYYIFSKRDKNRALEHIIEINQWCSVVEFGNIEVTKTCRLMKQNRHFGDLEDTLQYVMAKKIGADLILSNDKGFASDGIEVMDTATLCKRMQL